MLGALVLSQATLDPTINEMSLKYRVEPALVKAIIKTESNWDVNASRFEAHKGDASWGLMQVLLATARGVLGNANLTTTQLIQPRVNIEAGVKLMSQNIARYKGIIPDAIAAYNAGSARFKPAPKEYEYINQPYVDKVWKNYGIYKTLGGGVVADVATTISEKVTDIIGTDMTLIYMFAGLIAVGVVVMSKPRSSEG